MFVGELHPAGGAHALGGAIVSHMVGLQNPVLVIEYDRAVGRRRIVILVINEAVGVDVELAGIVRRLSRRGGRLRIGVALQGCAQNRGGE